VTTPMGAPPEATEARVVEELVRAIAKAQRALQMYLPNNPVYHRTLAQLTEAFGPVWTMTGRLVLDIEEQDILWEGVSVLPGNARGDGLAWQLYKDGLRRLTLLPGVENEEIIRFLEVVNRARLLSADASDDLLTLLWEQEFVLISYAFIEALGDGIEFLQESPFREHQPPAGAARDEVAEAGRGGPEGLVEIGDSDSTPYFLDEAEVRFIRSELEEEYRRDIRTSAIDALLDVLETVPDPAVRREVVSLLEDILPSQLAVGGFGAVAHILRELRVIIARLPGLDQELHSAVLSFESRLSEPAILEQLFRILEDRGVGGRDEDLGAVLRELKPAALPVLLAHLGSISDPAVRQVLLSSAEELAKAQPSMVASLLDSGTADVLQATLELVGRLKLQPLVPKVIERLNADDPVVRLAAVRSLSLLATPTAIDAIEGALLDEDRSVRQAALTLLQERGGSGGLRQGLEQLLFGKEDRNLERSERRTLYEAYAQVAGNDALSKFREILEPRGIFRRQAPPEIRACAIFGLARLGTFEARLLVDRFTGDKEPVVRSAANGVLREWRA
jgi:HEAT repeat protein